MYLRRVLGVIMSRDSVVLLVLVLALLAFGLVMLYSATAVTAEKSPRFLDDAHFLKKQLLWVMVSVGAMIVAGRVPFSCWARWRGPILLLTVAILGLVFVPGVGAQINAARRWIRVSGLFLQPSEAAKIGVAIFLCGFAAADPERLKSFFKGFVPAFAVLAVVCGLILVEPDIGTAVFIATVMTLTLVVAGIRVWHLVPSVLGGGGLAAYYALTHTSHVMARIQTYRHPELDPQGKGHQITQSIIALGSGGWTGVGLGQGTSKLYFLPEAHSDFIFPVIGEELGFLGATAMVILYMAIGFVGYRIMRRTHDRFAFLLSFAVTTYIILQAAMNVAVVTASMPTKGIPLPFVSAGGSSVLFTMIGVGILVNIANATERGECQERGSGSCLPEAAPAVTSSPA
jgi:cell division protein FtsW